MILSSLQHSAAEFNEETLQNASKWMDFCSKTGLGYLASTWCGDPLNAASNLADAIDWQTLTHWGNAVILGESGIKKLSHTAPSLKKKSR